MGQPSVKQDQLPANDSEYVRPADTAKHEEDTDKSIKSPNNNAVTRAIEEFREFIDELDDLREVLRSHGIPLRTTRMIVELGVQNKPDKQAIAIDAAMEEAEKQFGDACLTRNVLDNHFATIVNLEKNLTHARAAAREEGLDAQALSALLKMIQESPGDNGAKPVNTFLAYALAYGIKTEKLTEIAGEFSPKSTSVLPQIPRKETLEHGYSAKKLMYDSLVGLIIGMCVIYLLV